MKYKLFTEATNGDEQNLSFVVDGIPEVSPAHISLEVRETDGITVVGSDQTSDPDPDHPGKLFLRTENHTAVAKRMYVLVKREGVPPYPGAACFFRVGWSTNLNILFGNQLGLPGAGPLMLHVFEKTDSALAGDDEIFMTVVVDGLITIDDVYLGQFSNDGHRSLEDLVGPIRFFNNVRFFFREEDDFAEGRRRRLLDPDRRSAGTCARRRPGRGANVDRRR